MVQRDLTQFTAPQAWTPSLTDDRPSVTVTLPTPHVITAVGTQGRYNSGSSFLNTHVQEFEVDTLAPGGEAWDTVVDDFGVDVVFLGNSQNDGTIPAH